jgi:hypothetical protein
VGFWLSGIDDLKLEQSCNRTDFINLSKGHAERFHLMVLVYSFKPDVTARSTS